MNNRRKKPAKNESVKKKIIRCKSKMVPVFDTDICDKFSKKENTDTNKICRNCINSF